MFPSAKRLFEIGVDWFAKLPVAWIRWSLMVVLGLSSTVQIMNDRDNSLMNSSYDQLLKVRLKAPNADPSILIIDIDERSLDAMRTDYGRWPWPRETLASTLEWLEIQGVNAVVFDILFADQDTLNPLSDQVFGEAIQRSRSSYFPVLRLNPANDALSEIRPGMLPGFSGLKAHYNDPKTRFQPSKNGDLGPSVAVVPPIFSSALASQRLGYHNIYPDPDGVNRTYTLWEDVGSWRLNSLPARVALELGWTIPDEPKQIIRFPIEPYSHKSLSFIDIWKASQSSPSLAKPAWASELAGAVVIIGSTAPSLFDVKVTPLSPIHPGVHILANAIDNVKNEGFLHELPLWLKLLQCWFLLIFMAWLSSAITITTLRWAILFMPGTFLSMSFLSLQFGALFLDFTIAASQSLLFFSLLSMYFSLRLKYFVTPSGSFLRNKGYEAFLVIFHRDDERVKPQAILDDLRPIKSERLVFQSGWIGYELEKRLGPTLIWLRTEDETTIQRDFGLISKTNIVSKDRVWFSEIEQVNRNWEDEARMLQLAWSKVGEAFRNRQNRS